MKSRWIFLGLFAGLALGIAANLLWGRDERVLWTVKFVAEPVGELFLRCIFLAVPTLAFSALALGVASFRDLANLGRIALKTIAYTVVASSLAVGLGLLLANLFQPGLSISEETRRSLMALAGSGSAGASAGPEGLMALIVWIPNPLKWLGGNGILILLGSAVLGGILLGRWGKAGAPKTFAFLEKAFEISVRMIDLAMWLAPFGIAALVFKITASFGVELLGSLGAFGLMTLFGLAFHQFVTYGLILKFGAGVSPVGFFRNIREVMATAFATSSSNATLPVALKAGEENLKLPPDISRFVLTAGATANQNGTALYEGVTILFLAQLYLGTTMPVQDQLYVLGMAILAGVGTAGVPSGSIPFIALICQSIGVPAGAVGTILGLDRILDMCRTVLNVSGDLVAATFVAKSEERRARRLKSAA